MHQSLRLHRLRPHPHFSLSLGWAVLAILLLSIRSQLGELLRLPLRFFVCPGGHLFPKSPFSLFPLRYLDILIYFYVFVLTVG